MVLRMRISLIAGGVIIFLILGPAIIFLARGFSYDFANQKIVRTGTLVVKTDPRDAQVSLNGEKLKNTPLIKRFLIPGEYLLEVKKSGYFAWKKQIAIHSQQVANPHPAETEKIFLFLESPGSVLAPTSTVPIEEATTTLDYFLRESNDKGQLWQGTDDSPSRLILDNLPPFSQSKLVVTPGKQIFLLLDETLYQAGENDLQKINTPVNFATWNNEANGLLYGNDHEVWLFRPLSNKPNELITRSSQMLSGPVYNEKTGYLFVRSGHQIKAIEFDPSGEPNVYVLTEVKTLETKLWVNLDGTELTYLDGDLLHRLNIR